MNFCRFLSGVAGFLAVVVVFCLAFLLLAFLPDLGEVWVQRNGPCRGR